MKAKSKQSGLTLMEMTVVIVIIALLTSFALPGIRALFHSFETEGGAKPLISAALASARAMAAKHQRYAGIRFQQDLDGNHYMVFIINDPSLDDAQGIAANPPYKESNGFRVVEGVKPMRLPQTVGVTEFVGSDVDIDNAGNGAKVIDKTTFSVVFSPSGKLVVHFAPVLRKNANDVVFNGPPSPVIPMFQDDYDDQPPFQQERSQNRFIIYDKTIFSKVDTTRRWSGYLRNLEVIYINPYTGTMIEK